MDNDYLRDNHIRFERIEKMLKEIEDALFIAKSQMDGLRCNLQKEEPKKKKTIVFDFDGVIHTGYTGWKDGTIYGDIDEELLRYIWHLMHREGYYVVISSNRPAEQIVDFMNQWCTDNEYNLLFEVFNKDMDDNMYWTKDKIIGVTNQKAVGVLYIDDRGYRYKGLEDLKEYIEVIGVDK